MSEIGKVPMEEGGSGLCTGSWGALPLPPAPLAATTSMAALADSGRRL